MGTLYSRTTTNLQQRTPRSTQLWSLPKIDDHHRKMQKKNWCQHPCKEKEGKKTRMVTTGPLRVECSALFFFNYVKSDFVGVFVRNGVGFILFYTSLLLVRYELCTNVICVEKNETKQTSKANRPKINFHTS